MDAISKMDTTSDLSKSMRANYEQFGVEEYYLRVAKSYRNPHMNGIRQCVFAWLNKWWKMENGCPKADLSSADTVIFDMACGSGEVTLCVLEWYDLGKDLHRLYKARDLSKSNTPNDESTLTQHRKSNSKRIVPVPLEETVEAPIILAADPYTREAYFERVGIPCSELTFRNIAGGAIPDSCSRKFYPKKVAGNDDMHTLSSIEPQTFGTDSEGAVLDMVICSFALHLIDNASELFALLWELSTKFRWLVVLAPHKKPEIKDGWGWSKWNMDTWNVTQHTDNMGELLNERVHCRAYRSYNVV